MSERARETPGRIMILPGVGNTRFQLAGFAGGAARRWPGFEVEIRRWGVPLLTLSNLRAYARNLDTAQRFADDIAAWRQAHAHGRCYLVGYSGGGGIAALIAAALPAGVAIDRLILIAPAISPDYPLAERVLPHVSEFIASFASARDLQVSWGTRIFGTIDRKHTPSAGAVGFDLRDSKLLQHYWSADDARCGHRGNHWAYLRGGWQAARLLPALDPHSTAAELRAAFTTGSEGD